MKFMPRIIKSFDDAFGMSSLNPQKAGLGDIIIWSDHSGVSRSVSHRNSPQVKMTIGKESISVSISPTPGVLVKSKKAKVSQFRDGIDYVARNYDIFLKHYNDTTFEFDDEDFFQALRDRGEYK